MTRTAIVDALEALAVELASAEEQCDLIVVGGAALVLLYGARESTKDVDAFTAKPVASLRAAAVRIAESQSLPPDWLNDAAKGYVHGFSSGPILLQRPALTVRTLALEQLLAMKLSAWRDDLDIQDAQLLLSKVHGSQDEIWARVEPHVVPGREMKARYAFEDLWEAGYATR